MLLVGRPVIYKPSNNERVSGWQTQSSLLQEAEGLDGDIFSPISKIQWGKGPFDVHACFLMSDVIPHRLLHLLEETHAVRAATGGTKIVIISKLKAQKLLNFIHFVKLKKGTISLLRFHFMKEDFIECHTGTLIVRVDVDVLLCGFN